MPAYYNNTVVHWPELFWLFILIWLLLSNYHTRNYKLTRSAFRQVGISQLLHNRRTLPKVGVNYFNLVTVIEQLFDPAKHKILFNARKEAQLVKTVSQQGKPVYHEVDVWIPDLNLGFEYQVT